MSKISLNKIHLREVFGNVAKAAFITLNQLKANISIYLLARIKLSES